MRARSQTFDVVAPSATTCRRTESGVSSKLRQIGCRNVRHICGGLDTVNKARVTASVVFVKAPRREAGREDQDLGVEC